MDSLIKIGKIITSSTSKIRNKIAIRRNRIEKGRRVISLGENPHSKGLNFSGSALIFFPTPTPSVPKTITKILEDKINKIKREILVTYLL